MTKLIQRLSTIPERSFGSTVLYTFAKVDDSSGGESPTAYALSLVLNSGHAFIFTIINLKDNVRIGQKSNCKK